MNFLLKITVILIVILTGCTYHQDINYNCSYDDYTFIKQKIKSGHYKYAIKQLEMLKDLYPISPCLQQISMDLIHAYYKSSNLLLAQKIANNFFKNYPCYEHIDYILYMIGLINMELDSNVNVFYYIDPSDRDPKYAHIAFSAFSKLVHQYEHSTYVTDAIKRLIYLKNRLAKHELAIIKYYDKRKAYVAVIKRAEYMIDNFPDTISTRSALLYMEKADHKLHLKSKTDKNIKNF